MTDDEEDKRAASAFLGGFTQFDGDGVPRKKYLAAGSKDEDWCRAALVRLLRSGKPLDPQMREMLAQLIEAVPEPGSIWGGRKLVFAARKRGASADHGASTHIATFIWERAKSVGVEKAVEAAAEKFQLQDTRSVYKIWSRYKNFFQTFYGPINRP
jgi:hypothetical protein